MRLRYSGGTNVGHKRQVNQDSYGVGDPFAHRRQINQDVYNLPPAISEQLGLLLVVCDGMGGHTAGEVASRLGVETILDCYYESDAADRTSVLKHTLVEANQRIYAAGEGSMGTTGVAALFHQEVLHIANVGDSRAYLIRNQGIEQITRDHSLVAEQVAAGIITAEQARTANYRNMITRALGYRPDVEVDLFTRSVQPGDMVLLSTDGMHGLIEDREIAEIVSSMAPDEAVPYLIDISNRRGGPDNITVVIGKFEAGSDAATTRKQRSPADETTERNLQAIAPAAARHKANQRRQPSNWPIWAVLGLLVLLFSGGVVAWQFNALNPAATPGAAEVSSTLPTTNALTGSLPLTDTAVLTPTGTLTATDALTPTATITTTATVTTTTTTTTTTSVTPTPPIITPITPYPGP